MASVSYLFFFKQMGFYWDEWPLIWISRKLGDAGLADYFSTNRPFWGMIYRMTIPLLGSQPWVWHIFALFWRWLCAVLLWGLIFQTWPDFKEIAAACALLFLIYPGYDLQPIALMFGHFSLVLTTFLASLFLMAFAQRRCGWPRWILTAFSLAASLINLLAMEYFIVLDLIRLPLLWVIKGQNQKNEKSNRLKKTLFAWSPYAFVFIAVTVWRTFFFKFQTQNYQPVLLNDLRTSPFQTIGSLILTVLLDIFKVTIEAWGKIFTTPAIDVIGKSGLLLVILAAVAAALLVITWFFSFPATRTIDKKPLMEMLAVALAALLLGGAPFWLTGLPVGLVYQNSRFTLPFLLGLCLLVSAMLWLLPLSNHIKTIPLVVLVALSAAYQVQIGDSYRRDWVQQTNLFWQMAWRIPALRHGTSLVINNYPMTHVSDNSLSAPLNDIYAPDNHSQDMSFMLYYASLRGQKYFNDFKPGSDFEHNYLAAVFHGSSDRMLALYYDPPACLTVLDPDTDPSNALIPVEMRAAAALSALDLISDQPVHQPAAEIFGVEPAHNWCYFYEKADLARQKKDWDEVASLGDRAFAIKDYPNGPLERLPFIEGYAHINRWDDALRLSQETAGISPVTHSPLCALWQRIDRETPSSLSKTRAQKDLQAFLDCR